LAIEFERIGFPFVQIAQTPPGFFKTLRISVNDFGKSNQWNAVATVTKSTELST